MDSRLYGHRIIDAPFSDAGDDSRFVLSIDLDMWWHCRWATGSCGSMWSNTEALFADYYKDREPYQDLVNATADLLSFLDECDIKATFFILGEVADAVPEVVRQIASAGHEIACHGYHHVDITTLSIEQFKNDTQKAKSSLEELSGQEVLGFRAPNLIVLPWMFDVLLELGFVYDSSITPSRKFFGKYGGMESASNNPFFLAVSKREKDSHEDNCRTIVEFPIPSMPLLKLPACSGIITRILGYRWSLFALRHALRKGHALYYFHPYEIFSRPKFPNETLYLKLFLRNMGMNYLKMVKRIILGCKEQKSAKAIEVVRGLLEGSN